MPFNKYGVVDTWVVRVIRWLTVVFVELKAVVLCGETNQVHANRRS